MFFSGGLKIPSLSIPGIPLGSVSALVFDSSGNLYAGGDFAAAGGVSASRVAKWDGASWSALGSVMNSEIHALVIAGLRKKLFCIILIANIAFKAPQLNACIHHVTITGHTQMFSRRRSSD